jgi:FlaA1/EpsC-like NDP-sugar epimerase
MVNWINKYGSSSRYRRIVAAALLDFLIVIGAYLSVFIFLPDRIFNDHTHTTLMILAVASGMVAALASFKVYHRVWERTSGHSIIILLDAVVIVTVPTILVVAAVNPRPLSIGIGLLGNLLAFIGIAGVRYRSRLISGFAWRWHAWWSKKLPESQIATLIVGAGESGQALAWRMKHRNGDRFHKIVGFVDDDPAKRGLIVEGSPVLGACSDIPAVVKTHKIELIAVALHNITSTAFRDILLYCEKTDARIKIVPDILKQINSVENVSALRDIQPEDLLGRGVISRHEAVDLSPVVEKSILVTGAAGSIGSELSRQILSYQPKQVVLLDNNESGLHDLVLDIKDRHPELTIVPVLGDITICESMRAIFEKYRPEVVFHAAAYKHVPMLEYHPMEAVRVNIGGTKLLAELAQEYAVERFVLISTDKAVDPSSVMGASKRVCELMLHALCLQRSESTLFTAVRFGNVLGSRGSVVPMFTSQIEHGGPITVTHPDMTRYFMSIPEAVNLIIHAASMTRGDDIFILQMGAVVRIVELAERLIRLRGLRPHQDIQIQYTGIRPGEKMHEALYSGAEEPCPTAHPNIIKLNTWQDEFSASEFHRHLREMSNHGLHDAAEVLQRIRTAIGAEQPVAQELTAQ